MIKGISTITWAQETPGSRCRALQIYITA